MFATYFRIGIMYLVLEDTDRVKYHFLAYHITSLSKAIYEKLSNVIHMDIYIWIYIYTVKRGK